MATIGPFGMGHAPRDSDVKGLSLDSGELSWAIEVGHEQTN